MQRPPQLNRSFPVLTLLMAVPLVAILGYIAYARYVADDAAGGGWQTYRNENFGYELRYPPGWQIIYTSEASTNPVVEVAGFLHQQDVIIARDRPSTAGVWPDPKVWVSVNFQGGWCESMLRNETHDITVSGVSGTEFVCWPGGPLAETCKPQPRCKDEPFTILRRFDPRPQTAPVLKYSVAAYNNSFQPDGDAATTATLRKIVDTFRFLPK